MKFKVPKPHIPDIGKMGSYDNFNGDDKAEQLAKKHIRKYLLTFGIVLVIAAVLLVFITKQTTSEVNENVNNTYSSKKNEESSRYDTDVPTGEQPYKYIDGSTITGTYDKADYDKSVGISENLASKYSEDFNFYYIVDDIDDNSFYMSYTKSADRVFKVEVDSNGSVYDNLYSIKYTTVNDTQMWMDDYGENIVDIQGIVRSKPTTLLGSGGLNFGSMNDIQVRTAPNVFIFVGSKYTGGASTISDMFTDILKSGGGDSYPHNFNVVVVELESEDGVYEHLYEKEDVTESNYRDVLDVSKEHKYTITEDGTVS